MSDFNSDENVSKDSDITNVNNNQEEKSKICSSCGANNDNNRIYCQECGRKLEDETIELLVCPNCGTQNDKTVKFCGNCGFKLHPSGTKIDINKRTNNKIQNKNCNDFSEELKCPYCGSTVKRYIKKCPHCGEWLSGVSHFGCGSLMMILSTILGLILFLGGSSIDLPLFGASGGVFILICAFLYFLPSLISDWRGHDSKLAIFIVNLLLGWTIVGWFAALIFSFTGRAR